MDISGATSQRDATTESHATVNGSYADVQRGSAKFSGADKMIHHPGGSLIHQTYQRISRL